MVFSNEIKDILFSKHKLKNWEHDGRFPFLCCCIQAWKPNQYKIRGRREFEEYLFQSRAYWECKCYASFPPPPDNQLKGEHQSLADLCPEPTWRSASRRRLRGGQGASNNHQQTRDFRPSRNVCVGAAWRVTRTLLMGIELRRKNVGSSEILQPKHGKKRRKIMKGIIVSTVICW